MPPILRTILQRGVSLVVVVVLGGCAIAQPRPHDDPWQSLNRKTFAFNQAFQRTTLRPMATAYRKVTTPPCVYISATS